MILQSQLIGMYGLCLEHEFFTVSSDKSKSAAFEINRNVNYHSGTIIANMPPSRAKRRVPSTNDSGIARAVASQRESKYIEFKERFDVGEPHAWCEIIKDIVAIANSGGGHILFGVRNDGSESGWDCSPFRNLDSAQWVDKIATYVGEQYSDFEVLEVDRGSSRIAVMAIRAVHIPLIFIRPGTYEIEGGKQKTAFGRGTVYFRHGAKSEPGNSQDVRQCIQREIESIRKSWLGNIRKVVAAPHGHEVKILPPEVMESYSSGAMPIRLVDDPNAPAYRKIDPNKTHPFRQKEVMAEVNRVLKSSRKVTSYDIQCIRKVHAINESKSEFFYKPAFSSPCYSQAFVDWIVTQVALNSEFFAQTRTSNKA